MFDIDINFDDIYISNIEREDIIPIQKWINIQQSSHTEEEKPLGLKEFYERFLEYYVSESEFFLKINLGEEIIGVLKGRIEFKNPNEVWLRYFIIDNRFRGKGIGSLVIKEIIKYFSNGFGIYDFYAAITGDDERVFKFWKRNKFKLLRISKDFFDVDGESIDMLVLKAEIY